MDSEPQLKAMQSIEEGGGVVSKVRFGLTPSCVLLFFWSALMSSLLFSSVLLFSFLFCSFLFCYVLFCAQCCAQCCAVFFGSISRSLPLNLFRL